MSDDMQTVGNPIEFTPPEPIVFVPPTGPKPGRKEVRRMESEVQVVIQYDDGTWDVRPK